MFETSVKMVFSTQTHNMLEMGVIDVSINSEQSFEDNLNHIREVSRERNTLMV
jgi:hypothetical protein